MNVDAILLFIFIITFIILSLVCGGCCYYYKDDISKFMNVSLPNNNTDTMMTYVINLDKNKEKAAEIMKYLKNKNIKFERVSAVDGRAFKTIGEVCASEGYPELKCMGHPEHRGNNLPHIGCYLSHMKCLKMIANNSYEWGLILEDDAVFMDKTFSIKKLIKNSKEDFIWLNGGNSVKDMGTQKPTWGTQGYLIKRDAAFKLYNLMKPGSPYMDKPDNVPGKCRKSMNGWCLYDMALPCAVEKLDLKHRWFALVKQNDKLPSSITNTSDRPTIRSFSEKDRRFNETLKKTERVFKFLGIPFHIIMGTALGAHREGNFIAHDSDIDVAVFHKDVNTEDMVSKIKKGMERGGFEFVHSFGVLDRGYELTYKIPSIGVRIDIFWVYEAVHNSKKINWLATHGSECSKLPAKICVFGMTPYKLVDIGLNGVNYKSIPEETLVELYGEDWKIPKKFGYGQGIRDGHYKGIVRDFTFD